MKKLLLVGLLSISTAYPAIKKDEIIKHVDHALVTGSKAGVGLLGGSISIGCLAGALGLSAGSSFTQVINTFTNDFLGENTSKALLISAIMLVFASGTTAHSTARIMTSKYSYVKKNDWPERLASIAAAGASGISAYTIARLIGLI